MSKNCDSQHFVKGAAITNICYRYQRCQKNCTEEGRCLMFYNDNTHYQLPIYSYFSVLFSSLPRQFLFVYATKDQEDAEFIIACHCQASLPNICSCAEGQWGRYVSGQWGRYVFVPLKSGTKTYRPHCPEQKTYQRVTD